MKKLLIITVVTFLIALNLISIRTAFDRYVPKKGVENSTPSEFPNPFNEHGDSTPSAFLGQIRVTESVPSTPTPTSTPKTSATLMKELEKIVDDGDAAESNAIKQIILGY